MLFKDPPWASKGLGSHVPQRTRPEPFQEPGPRPWSFEGLLLGQGLCPGPFKSPAGPEMTWASKGRAQTLSKTWTLVPLGPHWALKGLGPCPNGPCIGLNVHYQSGASYLGKVIYVRFLTYIHAQTCVHTCTQITCVFQELQSPSTGPGPKLLKGPGPRPLGA